VKNNHKHERARRANLNGGLNLNRDLFQVHIARFFFLKNVEKPYFESLIWAL
jgi:hypothetical protein